VNAAAPGVPNFAGTPLGELAKAQGVSSAVLAGAAVENTWGPDTEVTAGEFTAAVDAFLGKPHGGHRAKLLRLHRRTYAKALECGDMDAAARAEAQLAELGDAAAMSRLAADGGGGK
jgi:hypothetical protein